LALIDEANAAVRLARSIVADLELYHGAQIAAGALPVQAIEEGRQLFRSRVVPSRYAVFEVTLSQSRLAAAALPVSPEERAAIEQALRASPRSKLRFVRYAITAVFGLGALAFFGYMLLNMYGGELVATVPIEGAGRSGQVPLQVPPGATLKFMVAASKTSSSGANQLLLEVQALKGDEPVATMSCIGYRFKRAGTAWGVASFNDDCQLVVAGGADGVRIRTHLSQPGVGASFEGLEIRVRRQ